MYKIMSTETNCENSGEYCENSGEYCENYENYKTTYTIAFK